MNEHAQVAVVGSGFAGSLIARILATQGYSVVLLERGRHPRFAIGESTTPLANLSLERMAKRYGLIDLYHLAAHGRWKQRYPSVRGGLKRGFTFYRHHTGAVLDATERLLVAASPDAFVSDSHWLRADVDHHFVREAVVAGVDYRDCAELSEAEFGDDGVRLIGRRDDVPFAIAADFVIDASGPNGFLARQLGIASGLERTYTRSGLVFGHFGDVRFMQDVIPDLTPGPFIDDWAAVHHIVDEGWMYSLRFDHGVVSAGFTLSPRGLASLPTDRVDAATLWRMMLERYPTIAAAFEHATPVMPIGFVPRIQHRLTRAVGDRWLLLPHAYAFVDPLFSTGIAWALRAIERVGQMFETAPAAAPPPRGEMERYGTLIEREADQIDQLVAGAYVAMAHFDLFAAQAMIYFATVSYAEARQRMSTDPSAAWSGFLGVGDDVCDSMPREALRRLTEITGKDGRVGSFAERRGFVQWVRSSIEPRNVVGLADPSRHHLYPVDLDVLIESHAKLGMTRDQIIRALPALRGHPEPSTES
ncbi:MAG TPA: FAD-dependent oxidoreductase [Gemmatimonadaceae bacterium]|nr:FAD-dependent oxidoreductase [Gemmatimonadaceae bacterium]